MSRALVPGERDWCAVVAGVEVGEAAKGRLRYADMEERGWLLPAVVVGGGRLGGAGSMGRLKSDET